MSNQSEPGDSFAAKVSPIRSAQVEAGANEPAGGEASRKKDPFDRTSTKRGQRLAAEIQRGGGATVILRLKTAEHVSQLDSLIAHGIGRDRNDVLRNLITEKAEEIKKSSK